MAARAINITVTQDDLEPDLEHGRQFGTIYINGVAHHLEAIKVMFDGKQKPRDGSLQNNFDAYGEACNGDGSWQTVWIDDESYCFFMTPHC